MSKISQKFSRKSMSIFCLKSSSLNTLCDILNIGKSDLISTLSYDLPNLDEKNDSSCVGLVYNSG